MSTKAKRTPSNVVSITDKKPTRKELNRQVERHLREIFDIPGSTWTGSTTAQAGATGCPRKPLRYWASEAESECERDPSNDDAFIKTTAVKAAMDLDKAGLLPAECGHGWNIPLSLVYEGSRAALKKMAGFDPRKGTRKQFVYWTARGTIQNLAWELYGPTGKRKHLKDEILPKLVSFDANVPEHHWGTGYGETGYRVSQRKESDNYGEQEGSRAFLAAFDATWSGSKTKEASIDTLKAAYGATGAAQIERAADHAANGREPAKSTAEILGGIGGRAIAPTNIDSSISDVENRIILNQLALSASLSTMDMDLLRKKHLEDISTRELAAEYGKSEKAIEGQLNRILNKLRAQVHKEDAGFAGQTPFLSK